IVRSNPIDLIAHSTKVQRSAPDTCRNSLTSPARSQYPTLLRPFRACRCAPALTQGDALGYRIAPFQGLRDLHRIYSPRAMPWAVESCPCGAFFGFSDTLYRID